MDIFLVAEFSKMKEELPENYTKPAAKADDVKSEPSAKESPEQSEVKGESAAESGVESKAGVPEEKSLASDNPSEGNVATAAAAALASAAVKAKVCHYQFGCMSN